MIFLPADRRQSSAAVSQFLAIILLSAASAISSDAPGAQPGRANAQAGGQTLGTGGDSAEIRQLIEKYAKSVDDADTSLAAEVWWDSPEVSFIHPLGHEHGFEQIKQNVYKHLMGDTFSERKLSPRDVAVHVHGDSAWAEFYWDFVAKYRKNGSPVTSHGRETQVYWKMQGRWRLVHVHYSAMPVAPTPQEANLKRATPARARG